MFFPRADGTSYEYHFLHSHVEQIIIYVTLPPKMSRMDTFYDVEIFALISHSNDATIIQTGRMVLQL